MSYVYTDKNGKKRSVPGGKKTSINISKEQFQKGLKKVHIHGLSWAGYVLDYADDLRKKALNLAVEKYGKGEVMSELSALRIRHNGNTRLENVIDSDMAYISTGKFEED